VVVYTHSPHALKCTKHNTVDAEKPKSSIIHHMNILDVSIATRQQQHKTEGLKCEYVDPVDPTEMLHHWQSTYYSFSK